MPKQGRRPNRLRPKQVTSQIQRGGFGVPSGPSIEKSLPAGLTGNLAGGVRDMSAQVALAQLQTLGEQAPMPRDAFPYAFGPGVPLYPAPLDPIRSDTGRAEPRIYEYPVSWNIPGTSTRLVPWQVLRRASNVGVIRDCIRIRKNEIVSLKWDISVSQDAVEAAQRDDPTASRADIERDLQTRLAPERARITEFWKKPDRGNGYDFGAWMMQALEEHLVLDALAIYPRYTLGGDLYSLEVLDGSTIKPLLDNRGGRPLPPYPAYQQILYGFPRGEYTADTDTDDDGTPLAGGYDADQLIYLRREVRTFSPYGLSAVEQSLTDLDLWMKRMAWMRAEYTDGVMPAGWLKHAAATSDSWSPQQITEYERYFNDVYSGNTDERQRFRFLPPGVEPVEGKTGADERYKPDYDLHLLKLVVAHFDMSIAELGFTEAKGLGSSGYHEGQENVQQRKGTRPDLEWMARIISDISRTHLAMSPELEFTWLGLDQEDEASADALNRARVDGAGMTLNEWRDALGRPRYDFPEADMPMIVSSRGGIVFLDGASKLEPAGVVIEPPKGAPSAPAEDAAEQQPGDDEQGSAPTGDEAAKDAEKIAYAKWLGKGARGRAFQWYHHTAVEAAEIEAVFKAGGASPKARTGQTWAGWTKDEETAAYWAVHLSQDLRGATDTQALAAAWAAARGLAKSTTDDRSNAANIADARIWLSTQGLPAALRSVLTEALHGIWTDGYYVGDRSAVWVLRDAIVTTATETGVAIPVQAAGHAVAGTTIDWAGWTPGDTDAARALLDGGLDRLLEQAGVTINSVLSGRLDALAEVLADGITGGLAPDTIARGLDDVLADPKWASLVAETEVSRAINFATQGRYLTAGITANTWMTAEDQNVCPACRENEDAGAVSIGQSFPSGASGPPGHPRCRCALAPDVQSIADIAWPTLADELNPTGAA